MNSHLFLINIPYNCSDIEVKEWIESSGIEIRSIRIVRDVVAGVSPSFGYVELKDIGLNAAAMSMLDGRKMKNQTVMVRETLARLSPSVWASQRPAA